MTHIDPFAPADSPQHPANFGKDEAGETPVEVADIAPPWIALPDDPIPGRLEGTPEGDAILDARWERYDELLRAHGTEEQVAYLDEVTGTWPDDMPTLAQLEEQQVAAEAAPPAPEELSADEDAEAELAAALEKLGKK